MAASSNDGSQLTDRPISCKENGPGGCTLNRPNISEWNSPMPKHPNITPELLRQLLRYEPDTGKLFWLPRPREMFTTSRAFSVWNSRHSGVEAFTASTGRGYKCGSIFDVPQRAHRIIWMICHGEIPSGFQLDHINGRRDDNRLENIRLALGFENTANTARHADSTSGVKGVSWDKRRKKWEARICIKGNQKHLGYFLNVIEAEAAYLAAAEEHQGQFAYHKRAQ